MTASAGRESSAGPTARSTAGSSAAPNSGSPDADMPGRSTAGDCRGTRNHAALPWNQKPGPAPLARADRSWPGSSVVDVRQEVARRMKVLYERVAGPASTSMPPPWTARSPTRTGRRRRWRRWPRRRPRGEKRDRRATWLRRRVPSDGGQWRQCRCCRWNRRHFPGTPRRDGCEIRPSSIFQKMSYLFPTVGNSQHRG